jgi:coenzyme F420-reducing hydrogenase beta subunit
MSRVPKVISSVVNNDLCIGCGLCVYKCPTKALEMRWSEDGFLLPEQISECDSNGSCLSVCPFNPFPEEEVQTENELAEVFLNKSPLYHEKVGKYNGIYAGFSNEHRLTSSSGGIATYFFTQLLERGIVDHVFSVKESQKTGVHYEYQISSSREEMLAASKTRYFPVTLATVMPEIHKLEGKVAIVGVACFIKAVRLAQHTEPALKDKIPFLVGIICGGVKSSFFTEYLASKAGVKKRECVRPEFRIKDLDSTANDYSFGCGSKGSEDHSSIKMRAVGDMWGTGFFKANACDFCDDVTTELADISVGDAWLEPFSKDGKGTNVVVTRSSIADRIIQEGVTSGDLEIGKLSLERFIASQQGSFNHRHNGLSYRINSRKKNSLPIPPKRFGTVKTSFIFKMVQFFRMATRKRSLEIWKETLDASLFDKNMKINLFFLFKFTSLNHYERALLNRLKKEKK